jgi:hypothetical protein
MLIVTNKPFLLSVVMLSVIMLSVIVLSVVMLNVIMLSVVVLNVVLPKLTRGQCYKTSLSVIYGLS